jgi:hypothetical protein
MVPALPETSGPAADGLRDLDELAAPNSDEGRKLRREACQRLG